MSQNTIPEMTREEFNRAFYDDDFLAESHSDLLPKKPQNRPCKKSPILQKNCTELAGKSSEGSPFYWGLLLEIQTQAESGLYYFRARYYDSQLGRFLSRDPLGYVDGMNLYGGYFVPLGVDPEGTRRRVGGQSGCCNGQIFNNTTQFCCDGQIEEIEQGGRTRCCLDGQVGYKYYYWEMLGYSSAFSCSWGIAFSGVPAWFQATVGASGFAYPPFGVGLTAGNFVNAALSDRFCNNIFCTTASETPTDDGSAQ